MPADGLAPNGARPSTGTMLTTSAAICNSKWQDLKKYLSTLTASFHHNFCYQGSPLTRDRWSRALILSFLLAWTSCWTNNKLTVIWDTMVLMWHYYNASMKYTVQTYDTPYVLQAQNSWMSLRTTNCGIYPSLPSIYFCCIRTTRN